MIRVSKIKYHRRQLIKHILNKGKKRNYTRNIDSENKTDPSITLELSYRHYLLKKRIES